MAKREVAPTDPDKPLYAEDIAKLERVSLRTAQYRLAELEKRFGPDAVGRAPWAGDKRLRRYTTAGAMARLRPSSKRHASEALERVMLVEDEQKATRRDIARIVSKLQSIEQYLSVSADYRNLSQRFGPLQLEGDETSESESSQRTSKRDEVERARRE